MGTTGRMGMGRRGMRTTEMGSTGMGKMGRMQMGKQRMRHPLSCPMLLCSRKRGTKRWAGVFPGGQKAGTALGTTWVPVRSSGPGWGPLGQRSESCQLWQSGDSGPLSGTDLGDQVGALGTGTVLPLPSRHLGTLGVPGSPSRSQDSPPPGWAQPGQDGQQQPILHPTAHCIPSNDTPHG